MATCKVGIEIRALGRLKMLKWNVNKSKKGQEKEWNHVP